MKTILRSDTFHKQYPGLILELYGDTPATGRYISDSVKGLEAMHASGKQTVFLHVIDENILIGHVGIMHVSADQATFGFFELKEAGLFHELWHQLLEVTRKWGAKKLFGPVNGTIWHPYRVISEISEEPFFIQEPLSLPGYYDLFISCSPVHRNEYHSAYRTRFGFILEQTRKSMQLLDQYGIRIAEKEDPSGSLKDIYDLSIAIFSASPGYMHLSYNDFAALYAEPENKNSKVKIFMVLHEDKPIGFSYNLIDKKTIIMKTIGLLPEWQEKGIGNGLVYAVHRYAEENNMQKVIYALIRADNRVRHFPKDDAVIFRRYVAFQYNL